RGLDPSSVPGVVPEAFAKVVRRATGAPPPPPEPAMVGEPPPPPPAPRPAKVVIAQQTDSLHAAPPPAGPDTGLVSEELLHRSLRANVELAEALASVVREMNLGLGAILSHAELLTIYREDAREKRASAVRAIQEEGTRLRAVIDSLGTPASGTDADPVGGTR